MVLCPAQLQKDIVFVIKRYHIDLCYVVFSVVDDYLPRKMKSAPNTTRMFCYSISFDKELEI